MTAKNHIIKMRINAEMHNLIEDVAHRTGFEKMKIARWLLNRGIMQLKADLNSCGGIDKIQFNVREINKINE